MSHSGRKRKFKSPSVIFARPGEQRSESLSRTADIHPDDDGTGSWQIILIKRKKRLPVPFSFLSHDRPYRFTLESAQQADVAKLATSHPDLANAVRDAPMELRAATP